VCVRTYARVVQASQDQHVWVGCWTHIVHRAAVARARRGPHRGRRARQRKRQDGSRERKAPNLPALPPGATFESVGLRREQQQGPCTLPWQGQARATLKASHL
jgi:hypothetical protein